MSIRLFYGIKPGPFVTLPLVGFPLAYKSDFRVEKKILTTIFLDIKLDWLPKGSINKLGLNFLKTFYPVVKPARQQLFG